jgi:hypothetical protein
VGLTGKNRPLPAKTVRLVAGAALLAAAGLTSGCMSSPTYGTDKTANEQLMSDVGGIFSFRPKKHAPIDYEPRPDLVKPVKGDETLPAPQQSIASSDNPAWPESPEQRLARVRAEADANIDDPNYKSPIVPDEQLAQAPQPILAGNGHAADSGVRDPSKIAAEKAEFKKRLKETQQGDSTNRKYLSEPPVEYREAAADAPQGEVGEDEDKKERRLKREARKKTSRGMSLDDLNPF